MIHYSKGVPIGSCFNFKVRLRGIEGVFIVYKTDYKQFSLFYF